MRESNGVYLETWVMGEIQNLLNFRKYWVTRPSRKDFPDELLAGEWEEQLDMYCGCERTEE